MMKSLKILAAFCGLLTVGIGTASATDAYPLYAMLDANTLQGVLNGIAALANSGMYRDLLLSFGLGGLGWMIILSATKRGTTAIIRYLLIAGLLISFVMGHKVSVQVIGQMDGKTYEVNNVPAVIAVPASWMSRLGFEGAKLIDTTYAAHRNMNADLTLTGGMPFSIMSQIMKDASTYRIRDPYLRSSLIHFIVDCGIPAIASGKLSMTQLIKSNNVWDLFSTKIVNPALETVTFGDETAPIPSGQVVTCTEAYTTLNTILPKSQTSMVKNLSKGFMAGITAGVFKDAITYNASSKLYNPTPGSYLQQAAILNLLNGPVQQYMGAKSKSAMLIQSFATSRAVAATETGWQTTGAIFAKTFGYLYSVMQILIYAVAPILFLFALFPGAMKIIFKNYVILLAWFPLTFIMLGIVNNLILGWQHTDIGNVFGNFGGLVRDSQALVTAKAANMQAVGAMLVSMTPMMAWMLLKGGQYAMTMMLGHTGSEKYGQGAAEMATGGNISTDIISDHNTNLDKQNLSRSTDIGAMPVTSNVAGAQALLRANAGGQQMMLNNAPDMMNMSHGQSTNDQFNASDSTATDTGGSMTTSDGFSESADVSQGHSNALSTNINGGFQAGNLIKSTAGALMAKAALGGVILSEATATGAATDLVDAKMAGNASASAAEAGDSAGAQSFAQESKNLISGAMTKLEDTWSGAPWYDKGLIAGVVAAGTIAAFGTGIGEAAAVTAGAAEVGGAALGEVTAAEGTSGVASSVVGEEAATAETAAGAEGASKLSKLKKAGLLGLAGGLAAGISEEYSGRSESKVGDLYGSKQGVSGDTKSGFSSSHKADHSSTLGTDSSARSNYQAPNDDFFSALGETGTTAPPTHLARAQQTYNQQQYDIKHTSADVQDKIHSLREGTDAWRTKVNMAVDNHKGLNQLSKSDLQKDAGNYDVKQ